jgi:O-antigen/teichoic acid export membrane protein
MPYLISNLTRHLSGSNLKARCARSSFVLVVSTVIEKALAFGSKIIMVRLLLPEEVGLMVLIVSLTVLFDVFTEVGIKQSVIQNKNGADPEYLNTAWWFQCLRGTGLYTIAFLVTPFLCRFYFADKPEVLELHTWPELFLLVRIAFLSVLFGGFISPGAYILEKKFRFGKAALLMQGSGVLGAIITIILVLVLRNVWAMVIGFTCMIMLRSGFSFILCPFRPRFHFDIQSFWELSRFARGVFGSPLMAYLAFNGDVLVAGRLVSSDLLGMYGMAMVLARIPRELFSRIIRPILLPAFAEKQDSKEVLCDMVVKITKVTILLTMPMMFLGILCSKTILSVVYNVEFAKVAVPFGFLCVYVVLFLQATTLSSMLFGIGQPGKHRVFVGLRVLIMGALLYPAIKSFGMTGAAGVVLLSNAIAFVVQVIVVCRIIELKVWRYATSWLYGLILSVPVLLIVGVLQIVKPGSGMLHLVVGVLSVVAICFTGLFLFKH